MRFYSKASNLRVQLIPGGWRPDPVNHDVHNPVPGDYADFVGGVYNTEWYNGSLTQEQVIEKLRSHDSYGYPGTPARRGGIVAPNQFWAETDRPESERVEEELARLRAEVDAYRKLHGPQVVVVERTVNKDEDKSETGLQKLNRLKVEVAKAGITAEKSWKAEDYERALSAVKEE